MLDDGCQNFTVRVISSDEAQLHVYTPLHRAYLAVFLPVILFIGILSNSAFLFAVYRANFLHTVTGCYLSNLAVADMIFLVAASVPKIINYMGSSLYPDDSPIGIEGCIVGYVSANTSYFASLLFITYISWERFRAVCRPHQNPTKWRKIGVLVVATWISCFGFSLTFIPAFAILGRKCLVWPENDQYSNWPNIQRLCLSISPLADSYAEGAQTTPFFVCFIINLILYKNIIKGLRESSNKLLDHRNSSQSSEIRRTEREKSRIQITRMLLVNSVIFFLLLSPFEFLSLTRSIRIAVTQEPYTVPANIASTIGYIFRLLAYTNSIINPFVYTALSSRFRDAFAIAYCRKPAECQQYDDSIGMIRVVSK